MTSKQLSLRTALAAAAGAALLAGTAAAQGSDSCASPQVIAGLGVHAFDNSTATTDGNGCNMTSDVWFSWTAPSGGVHSIRTCGLATTDTVLAAYNSVACPPTGLVACNDDACGLQSGIAFNATAGTTYLIQVGSFGASPGGAGQIEIMSGGAANNCSFPAAGPDVIVGEVSGVSTYGTVSGTSAYSLGTTSCNVGTAQLLWEANNPNHPVIGQNIFRLDNGRFQQLGQSWLKHGFTALQQNTCCPCNSSGTGTRLGVGCSDPYGSSLNGSQSGLGPRSQVNAYTGAFSYPYGSQGQTGNAIYKRCQVQRADVDPANYPNAQYFGEAQYVTPDDAAVGNHFNNASWRRLNRPGTQSSGSFTLSTTGPTHRGEPAVFAWRDADPTVDIQKVDIANEGRLWVASNCYDDGSGLYRYEYVVFNLNSHRSVRSFTVPTGGSTVTGIGMSHPPSHSGEPFSNDPWAGQNLGDRIEWSTETFATNANANAIRWGTTYSFWFVSSAPPEVKVGTLGLFRSGPQPDPTVQVCGPIGGAGGPIVVQYCNPVPNSTGSTGLMDATNIDLMARTMELTGDDLPATATAFSLCSRMSDFVTNPGGSTGHLCLGGSIGRFVGGSVLVTSGAGTLSESVNLDALPLASGATAAVAAGETWHFQYWHRDVIVGLGIPTSNFTNGVRVIFP